MQDEVKDLVNAHLETLRAGAPTTVELVKKLTDAGKAEKINVTFTRQVDEPQRTESPARAHRFFALSGFVDYLRKHGGSSVTALADADSGDMAAVLEEDTTYGYEVVTFSPRLHPLYAPWQQSFGVSVKAKELAQFLIANRCVVISPSPDRLVSLFKQVQVSKSVRMLEGTGKEAINGVMCTTKIQGREDNQVTPLPETILIECPMFVDSEPQKIQIDLLLEVHEDDHVYTTLVSADANVKRIQAIESMLDRLRATLPTATVSLGRLSYRDWNYLQADEPSHIRNVPVIEYAPEAIIRNDMTVSGSLRRSGRS
jgi:hypothetical protein